MSKPITGDEPNFPGKMWGQQEYPGITMRQQAIKDFMCAIVSGRAAVPMANNVTSANSKRIAEEAEILADAYFEILK